MDDINTKVRVLGIDPGLNTTGYGVLEVLPTGIRLAEAGIIRSGNGNLAERLEALFRGMNEVLEAFQPSSAAIEELYSHYERPRTAILMGHARGVLCLAVQRAGVPITHYAATAIKKLLTGHGRAPKSQVQAAICREFHLAQPPEPPDVADALAIALCHCHQMRISPQLKAARAHKALALRIGMRTKVTGRLIAVVNDHVTLEVGAFEYEVLVPDFFAPPPAASHGRTSFLAHDRIPRWQPSSRSPHPSVDRILSVIKREFFEMFCSVDGVGPKKALRAMVRPVQDVAVQIEQQDAKALATLPGVGAATAERIIAKLPQKCHASHCS